MRDVFDHLVVEGDGWLAFDKPSGISVLADRSGAECLWDLLERDLARRGQRPLLVHRLDKGTSGVFLVATRPDRQAELTRAFQAHAVRKFYVARVAGALRLAGTGLIDLPLTKGRKSRYRIAAPRATIRRDGDRWFLVPASREGFASATRLRRLAGDARSTLLALNPRTGRTHQLRVHLAWIGFPILGDTLYGKPAAPLQRAPRLALHCHRLVFRIGGEAVAVTAPVEGSLLRR